MTREKFIGIIAIVLLLLVIRAYVEAENHIRWYSNRYQQLPRFQDNRPRASFIRRFIRLLLTLKVNA